MVRTMSAALAVDSVLASPNHPHTCRMSGKRPTLRPPRPPRVQVTPLGENDAQIERMPVLARSPQGISVSVHAVLSFLGPRPAAVENAVRRLGEPGTLPRASDPGIAATSPEQRILSLTTPRDLPPGQYPVFYDFESILMPEQQFGIEGPFHMYGQIGVIVITEDQRSQHGLAAERADTDIG